jgi:glucosamine-6-phosphate deaminase
VNELELDLKHCHFWAMDEWAVDGKPAGLDFPLGFAKTNLELCFNRIHPKLRMPQENLHFPIGSLEAYSQSYDQFRCVTMQGGQGEVKHWAFNDPPRRGGKYQDAPPSPAEYRQLPTRLVELHPMTLIQNARTSAGGVVSSVPQQAISVGPVDLANDFAAPARQQRADVATGRPPARPLQLFTLRHRQLRGGDALREKARMSNDECLSKHE